jgi:thymidylate synthase
MPEGSGIPPTTSDEKIQQYFYEYLVTDTKEDKEDYTYGWYAHKQIPRVIEILNKSHGNSNQGCITVGDTESIFLGDPPCLRVIDFKVVDGKLNMTVFFRSWDCFTGLPENLGGLQLLKEYLLMHLDFPVEDGKIIAYSSGLHLYEMYFPVVNTLNIDRVIL